LSGFAYNSLINKYKGLLAVGARFALMTLALVLGAPLLATAQEAGYTVKPGDGLEISVWKEPDLQGPVLVTPDGFFSFPLVGHVDARGKTVTDLQQVITERLAKYISDPVVTVSIREVRGNKVYVIGQVNRPGEFIVNPRVDVMQALSMAGGTTAFAALDDIRILRRSGAKQESLEFDYNAVARGKALEQNIELRAGDIVVVP
jgi:polysaccharide export outer membrane protein